VKNPFAEKGKSNGKESAPHRARPCRSRLERIGAGWMRKLPVMSRPQLLLHGADIVWGFSAKSRVEQQPATPERRPPLGHSGYREHPTRSAFTLRIANGQHYQFFQSES